MAKTKAKTRKPRPKREKPAYFPDMAPPSFPDIEEAADTYRDRRDERMQVQEEEVNAQDALLARMDEHGLTEYAYDGYKVRISQNRKVSCRKDKPITLNGDGE